VSVNTTYTCSRWWHVSRQKVAHASTHTHTHAHARAYMPADTHLYSRIHAHLFLRTGHLNSSTALYQAEAAACACSTMQQLLLRMHSSPIATAYMQVRLREQLRRICLDTSIQRRCMSCGRQTHVTSLCQCACSCKHKHLSGSGAL